MSTEWLSFRRLLEYKGVADRLSASIPSLSSWELGTLAQHRRPVKNQPHQIPVEVSSWKDHFTAGPMTAAASHLSHSSVQPASVCKIMLSPPQLSKGSTRALGNSSERKWVRMANRRGPNKEDTRRRSMCLRLQKANIKERVPGKTHQILKTIPKFKTGFPILCVGLWWPPPLKKIDSLALRFFFFLLSGDSVEATRFHCHHNYYLLWNE